MRKQVSNAYLGAKFREVRIQKGYASRADLSEASEKQGSFVSEKNIQRIETGHNFALENFESCCRVLGVSPSYFLKLLDRPETLTERHKRVTEKLQKRLQRYHRARTNPYLYEFLAWYYKDFLHSIGHELYRIGDSVTPLVVYEVDPLDDEMDRITSNGFVSLDEKVDPYFERRGKKYIEQQRQLKIDPNNLWDGPIYRMIKFDPERLKMEFSLGSYFGTMKTSYILQDELLSKFVLYSPEPRQFKSFRKQLTLRNHLHDKLGEKSIFSPASGRVVGISSAAAFIYKISGPKDTFDLMVKRRSSEVGVHQLLLDVVPSFMFHPTTPKSFVQSLLQNSLLREYLEEYFNKDDRNTKQSEYRYEYLWTDPNVRYLSWLYYERAKVKLFLTGIAFDLILLSPHITLGTIIEEDSWFYNHAAKRKVGPYQLDEMIFNYEWDPDYDSKDVQSLVNPEVIGRIPLGPGFTLPDNFLKIGDFAPSALATITLALKRAKELIK